MSGFPVGVDARPDPGRRIGREARELGQRRLRSGEMSRLYPPLAKRDRLEILDTSSLRPSSMPQPGQVPRGG